MEMEKTLVLLKPNTLRRRLMGEIIKRIENKNLQIVAVKMLWVDEELAADMYKEHLGKDFYENLIQFVTSSPSLAMVIKGVDAIKVMRKLMGATNPFEAEPGTIRGDFGLDLTKNMVHGSDSLQSAKREIALFFNEEEILEYECPSD
jgi:nucleoside-diphosphate kinase